MVNNMQYTAKTFNIPELTGISRETIDEHIGLYNGYVKHVNLIHEKIAEYDKDAEANSYAIAEIRRRLGFEFGGMKNHEYYFTQFEGGQKSCPEGSFLTLVNEQFGSLENLEAKVRQTAKTRGVGWVMIYIDHSTNRLVNTWVDEQQLGQLADVDIVLALDMWEHSYMRDYAPSKKMSYVDAFFANLNWEVVSSRV